MTQLTQSFSYSPLTPSPFGEGWGEVGVRGQINLIIQI